MCHLVDSKLSDKSLIQMRKKCGPRMELCGTPAVTGSHLDIWP